MPKHLTITSTVEGNRVKGGYAIFAALHGDHDSDARRAGRALDQRFSNPARIPAIFVLVGRPPLTIARAGTEAALGENAGRGRFTGSEGTSSLPCFFLKSVGWLGSIRRISLDLPTLCLLRRSLHSSPAWLSSLDIAWMSVKCARRLPEPPRVAFVRRSPRPPAPKPKPKTCLKSRVFEKEADLSLTIRSSANKRPTSRC